MITEIKEDEYYVIQGRWLIGLIDASSMQLKDTVKDIIKNNVYTNPLKPSEVKKIDDTIKKIRNSLRYFP